MYFIKFVATTMKGWSVVPVKRHMENGPEENLRYHYNHFHPHDNFDSLLKTTFLLRMETISSTPTGSQIYKKFKA
jgi:hypothetical protein